MNFFVYANTVMLATAIIVAIAPGCSNKQDLRDAIVSGSSMAPSIVGKHFQLTCRDCKYQFPIDANNTPKSKLAVCPNCGFAQNNFADSQVRQATSLILNQSPPIIQRWDIVAFRDPLLAEDRVSEHLEKYLTKRVGGLPGENIRLVAGNVFVDGKLLQKPADVIRELRIPVFDSKFDSNQLARWKTNDSSNWNKDGPFWTFEGEEPGSNLLNDWLTYQHIRGYRHSGVREAIAPIEDAYAYNQNLARKLHLANEVDIKFRITVSATARFVVLLEGGRHGRVEIEFQFDRQQIILRHGEESTETYAASWMSSGDCTIEVANIDSFLRITVDSKPCFSKDLASSIEQDQEFRCKPLSIAIRGVSGFIQLRRIQIYRDIYYYWPDGQHDLPKKKSYRLGDDEYFVLGDNVPVSIDSRKFGAVPRDTIIGVVDRAKP